MLRPKRSAAQRNKKQEDKNDDENDLGLSEESDDGDFSSASSDEYDPRKDKASIEETFEESESEEVESDEEASFAESPVKLT